jgi:hypothetical protein
MTSSLACGILWRFGAIIPAPRSSVKNAMAGDAHAQLRRELSCCCQRRGARVGRVWMWLDRGNYDRNRSDAPRMDVRQRNAKNQRHCTHALYRPGTPDPRHVVRVQPKAGVPSPRRPSTPCLRLRYPNCLLTTVPERVVSVGRKPRERCRVPKVQAALCPATMPYRRLIDDARRP